MPVMPESEIGVVHADAWVTTAYGDPTSVMERREVEVRAPGANEGSLSVNFLLRSRTWNSAGRWAGWWS